MARRSARKKLASRAERSSILDKELSLSGVGEDPVVRALLDYNAGRIQLTPTDKIDLGIQLMKLEGRPGMDQTNPDLVNDLKARAHAYMRDEAKWNKDRQGFIEGVLNDADKIMPTVEEKSKIQARVAQEYASIRADAVAQKVSRDMRAKQLLSSGPKETIFVEGKIEMHRVGDGIRPVNVGEIISVYDQRLHFGPGKHEVHPAIAEAFRQRQESEAETSERKTAMAADMNSKKLAAKMRDINERYRTNMETA